MNTSTNKRFVGEVVELSRDCELGQEGERAVVTVLAAPYMTLTFPDRAPDCRAVHTGADYKYLRDPRSRGPFCLALEEASRLRRLLRDLVDFDMGESPGSHTLCAVGARATAASSGQLAHHERAWRAAITEVGPRNERRHTGDEP